MPMHLLKQLADRVDDLTLDPDRVANFQDISKNEDFFYGDSIDHMEPHEGEDEEDFQKKAKPRANITRRIFNTFIGQIYGKQVLRSFESESNQTLLEQVLLQNDGLTVQGREWQTMSEISGYAAVIPRFDRKRKRFFFNAYTAAETFVFTEPEDSKRIAAVVLSYAIENTLVPRDDEDSLINVKEVWTPEEFAVFHDDELAFSEDGEPIEGTHKFGEVPIAFFMGDTDYRSFTPRPMATDIVKMHETVEVFLKDFAEIFKYQAFNILFAKHPSTDEIVLAPSKAVTTNNPDGDLKSVQFQADLMNVANGIKFYLDMTADMGEIPSFWLSNAKAGDSGVALKIRFVPHQQANTRRITGYRTAEMKLWRNTIMLAKQEGMSVDVSPEAMQATIDYSEYSVPTEVSDELADRTFRLSKGMTTPAELLREDNPELTVAESEKIITNNLAENQALGITGPPQNLNELAASGSQATIDLARTIPPALDVTV